MGYRKSALRERGTASWFTLLVAFPVHWILGAVAIWFFGVGTGWEAWYIPGIIVNILHMSVHSPLSLRWDVDRLSESWVESIWGEVVHASGFFICGVSMTGLLSTAVRIPFNSATWTMMGMFLMSPLGCLVDHITNFAPSAIRGGNTPISIIVFHASNGIRLVDPVADFALGFELLQQARMQACPWHRVEEQPQSQEATSTGCMAHHTIAWIIIAAACVDFLILAAYMNVLKGVMRRVPQLRNQRVVEVVMLLCEMAILVAVVIISRFNMMDASSSSGSSRTGRDLDGYVTLCSLWTFGALLTTTLLLILPASFWERLEAEGPVSVCKQVVARLSLRAQAFVHRASTGGWLRTPRRSTHGRTAVTPGPVPDGPCESGAATGQGASCTAAPGAQSSAAAWGTCVVAAGEAGPSPKVAATAVDGELRVLELGDTAAAEGGEPA